MHEGAVITIFPNDVVLLTKDNGNDFEVEMLKYDASLLREASLQLEQTVYSALREDRCRQDSPVVTNIISHMFALLRVYFDQAACTCLTQLVLCQLKAFFIGFNEYLLRNPQYRPDEIKSYRVRELFNHFMHLMGCQLLCRPDEHYAQISHQHRATGDGTHPKDHHRPVCHTANQDAIASQSAKHQGNSMGISFL